MALGVLHCLWSGEIGGAERAVEQLVRVQLRDPDLAPALLFAQPRGPYWERARTLGCPVVELDLPHGHSLARLHRVSDVMRGFDIHHFHSAEVSLMASSIACRSARRIYTHRGGLTDYPIRTRMRYALTGFLLRHWFHAISGNTSHAACAAARLFRIDVERIAVTYNGVEFGLLQPVRHPDDVREELGLEAGAFVIGTAANLKPWKRIDRLLLAAKGVGDERVRVLVLGDGVDRQRLEEVATRNGLESMVIFAGAKRHVADYLQVMDAFCLPSTGLESFGNAVVEAMGLGLPTVILADGGGMLEHIDDGRNGFIAGSQSELEGRLSELARDSDLRRRVGKAAMDVRARYSPERAARAYRDLYERALRA